jgi:hypothetical protein
MSQTYYAVHQTGNNDNNGVGQKIGVFTNRVDYKPHEKI